MTKESRGYELHLWLQNQLTKILSNCCEGKALPMLTEANYLHAFSRMFLEKLQGRNQKRQGMVEAWWYSSDDILGFHGLHASIQPLLLPKPVWCTISRIQQQAVRRLNSETVWLSPIRFTDAISWQTPPHVNMAIYSTIAWSSIFQFHKSTWGNFRDSPTQWSSRSCFSFSTCKVFDTIRKGRKWEPDGLYTVPVQAYTF